MLKHDRTKTNSKKESLPGLMSQEVWGVLRHDVSAPCRCGGGYRVLTHWNLQEFPNLSLLFPSFILQRNPKNVGFCVLVFVAESSVTFRQVSLQITYCFRLYNNKISSSICPLNKLELCLNSHNYYLIIVIIILIISIIIIIPEH